MKLKISSELSSSKAKHTMPQSQATLFSWELKSNIPKQAEVLAYRAADIFDDRFHSIEQGQNADNMLVIKLGLAQQWTYYCTEDGGTSAAFCKSASMMRRVLLKQGTYLYMYRINGELKLNVNDKVTRLATKREVNYIDVRQNDDDLSYQGNFLFTLSYVLLFRQEGLILYFKASFSICCRTLFLGFLVIS